MHLFELSYVLQCKFASLILKEKKTIHIRRRKFGKLCV